MSYAYLKLYGEAMAQRWDNDNLLVQTFPMSLTGAALIWFTKLDIFRIKRWTNLAHMLIKQYKLIEIVPGREQL